MKVLIVHGWSSECGECGYGTGGWAASPALDGKPILTPSSETCPGCGIRFTHRRVHPAMTEQPVHGKHSTGRCPTCGSDDQAYDRATYTSPPKCSDPWHDGLSEGVAAGGARLPRRGAATPGA